MADYTAMESVEMLTALGDDAGKWAAAFCQTFAKVHPDQPVPDEGWMIGWFANAIEHSHDVRTGGGPVVLPDGSAVFVASIGSASP